MTDFNKPIEVAKYGTVLPDKQNNDEWVPATIQKEFNGWDGQTHYRISPIGSPDKYEYVTADSPFVRNAP